MSFSPTGQNRSRVNFLGSGGDQPKPARRIRSSSVRHDGK